MKIQNIFKRVTVVVLLLPFFSQSVLAFDTKVPDVVEPVSVGGVLQMTIGLFFVVLLIFIISWLVKRVSGFSVYSNPHLKIISGLHVGQKEKILLIQVADKQLVIGVTPYSVRTLHELESVIVNDDVMAKPNISFSDKLLQALKKEKK
ncbi:MAG: flagellar biosynthetic protein FliO [Gammaproteobacteria bacterium]|nr:flagellar biosynthetic protein FliO [Gammaproteobacteria bacterium]